MDGDGRDGGWPRAYCCCNTGTFLFDFPHRPSDIVYIRRVRPALRSMIAVPGGDCTQIFVKSRFSGSLDARVAPLCSLRGGGPRDFFRKTFIKTKVLPRISVVVGNGGGGGHEGRKGEKKLTNCDGKV